MSYNIDSSEYLQGSLSIRVGDFRRLATTLRRELPEVAFLNEGESPRAEAPDDEVFPVSKFWWYGDGSGHSYRDVLLTKVVPYLIGSAEIVFTWEGGDSFSGLRIKNGKAVECDVQQTLVPKKGER